MENQPLNLHKAHPESMFRNILCLFALSALNACGGGEDGIACTTEARPSVLLTVVDQLNAPLPNVTVSYQVNGGTAQSQVCEPTGSCSIAFEVSGVFSISASKTGYRPASGSVTVTRDVCHVNTERLTLIPRAAG